MNKEELLSLRSKVFETLMPLIVESSGDAGDRFELLIRMIRAGDGTKDVYAKAFEAAQSVEAPDVKLRLMLELLNEIDLDVADRQAETEQAANGVTVTENTSAVEYTENNNQES